MSAQDYNAGVEAAARLIENTGEHTLAEQIRTLRRTSLPEGETITFRIDDYVSVPAGFGREYGRITTIRQVRGYPHALINVRTESGVSQWGAPSVWPEKEPNNG